MIETFNVLEGSVNNTKQLEGVLSTTVEYIQPLTQEKNVKPTDDTQVIVADEGYNSLSRVIVEPVSLQNKETIPNEETQTIRADNDFNGLKEVVIKPIPGNYIKPSGTLEITKNDSYFVTNYEKVEVNVPKDNPILQERVITPSEETQNVTPGVGYDGLSKVTINPIPTTYVKPSGTLPITTNGTHDVKNYEYVSADVHDGEPVIKPYTPRFITFYNYSGTELNEELSNLDTSNMTTLKNMFNYCTNLKTVDIKHFNTSKVVYTDSMFANCNSLTSIDLSGWNVSSLANTGSMFSYCTSLTEINLSTWNPTKMVSSSGMFNNCKVLKKLDIRNWVFTSSLNSYNNMFVNVPKACLIIVKDDTARNWVKARRSDLTNIKTVAELGE